MNKRKKMMIRKMSHERFMEYCNSWSIVKCDVCVDVFRIGEVTQVNGHYYCETCVVEILKEWGPVKQRREASKGEEETVGLHLLRT